MWYYTLRFRQQTTFTISARSYPATDVPEHSIKIRNVHHILSTSHASHEQCVIFISFRPQEVIHSGSASWNETFGNYQHVGVIKPKSAEIKDCGALSLWRKPITPILMRGKYDYFKGRFKWRMGLMILNSWLQGILL